jgi:hypothetical protein
VSRRSLAEKVVALAGALEHVPHAFGGALALAYYAEPRATVDIDLNVFVDAAQYADVASPLSALGVTIPDDMGEVVARDGQGRVFWDETPIDLFFAYDRFHRAAAASCRNVPFGDSTISILGPEHLVVCKVIFDRARDWVDVDAMRQLGTPLDAAEVLRWVGRIAGDDDPRFERIAAVLAKPAP